MGRNYLYCVPLWIQLKNLARSHCRIYITIVVLLVFPLWILYYNHGLSFIPIVDIMGLVLFPLWNLYCHHGFSRSGSRISERWANHSSRSLKQGSGGHSPLEAIGYFVL